MRTTRQIKVGPVAIGGGAPVSIQSMTNTPTGDVAATLGQIRRLAGLGCEIIRVALPSAAEVDALAKIGAGSPIPVVADIHFDHRLALAAIAAGAAGIRVNPGNLKDEGKARLVARAAAAAGCAVRIGVNGGSLAPAVRERLGHGAVALVESALEYVAWFEEEGCRDLKVSLKSSDVRVTVEACRAFAARSDLPLHLGVTEAGTMASGLVKSAMGIGALLLDGIGETIRVSLTAPPEEEIVAARRILEAAGLRIPAPEIISCPTCGRTGIGLFQLVAAVEEAIAGLQAQGLVIGLRKVAVMGCEVNGPGEARDADVGIAGGKGRGILFRHGEKVRSMPEEELLPALLAEIRASCRPRLVEGNGPAQASGH
ncbi:MAG: flavodoxin-dependent (E)-4-hydroxy-3-methylbut-2-enyl-diphosphate synthase [Lentisphaeria bacterium]|nr:flavodoxin-dependent (E)-4-hydroxy-3-methylbut-2-enyl-diphosphate synthase [Lentisphaeria bacterium]